MFLYKKKLPNCDENVFLYKKTAKNWRKCFFCRRRHTLEAKHLIFVFNIMFFFYLYIWIYIYIYIYLFIYLCFYTYIYIYIYFLFLLIFYKEHTNCKNAPDITTHVRKQHFRTFTTLSSVDNAFVLPWQHFFVRRQHFWHMAMIFLFNTHKCIWKNLSSQALF